MDVKRVVSAGGGYPFAVGLVVLASLVLLPFRGLLTAPTVMLLYVPVIIAVARLSGVRPSTVAAVLAFVALDLLFVPPYYRFTVASLPEWLGLLVFLIVALVSGQQTGQLRQRERAALRRQDELELLNRLSFRIASEKSVRDTAEFIVSQVTSVLKAQRAAVYVLAAAPNTPSCAAAAGSLKSSSGETALVGWVLRTSKAVGLPAADGVPYDQRLVSVGSQEAIPGVTADGLYLPLQTSTSLEGVLFVTFGVPQRPTADDARLLAAVANLAASSLERQRLEQEASHAEALREADRLKTTLVSSVSHELKTPLAAATARVTGLVEEGDGCDQARVHEELVAVAEDLDRLNESIGDLLDLSRLESDAWQTVLEDHDVSDILGTVLSRLPAAERDRVRFELADDLPPVRADFAQIARALKNLVENALVYSPSGSEVVVGAAPAAGRVAVWVEDRGPGIPDAEKELIFEKFYRGSASASAPSGTGLGLAITREIVRSNDGTVRVEDPMPVGARFVVTLPTGTEGPA